MPSGAVTVGGLVINLSANTGQLKSDMTEASASVKTSSQEIVNAWAGVATGSDSATAAGERMVAQLKQEIATFGMSKEQLAQQKASLSGVGAEYEALTQRLTAMKSAQTAFTTEVATTNSALRSHGAEVREASGHVEEFGFRTASSKRELVVLAHELSQGNYKKFGGSILVLAEQTGAAGLLFSAAGLAVLGLGAAVLGVGTAIYKGAEVQREMNNALIQTGNYAGLTSESLNALAHSAVAAGGSLGDAKKTVIELAATGKFTGQQIGYITEAAVSLEHVGGQSIEKTIEAFTSLAVEASGNSMRTSEAISKAAIKVDEQYHFLTESVYEQIRALEKEGDQKGASALATETLAKVTKERAEEMEQNIGSIRRGWNSVKEAIGGVTDALGDIGKKATPQDAIDKYKNILETMDARPGWISGNGQGGGFQQQFDESRMRIVKALTAAVIEKNNADAAGIKQGKDATAQQEAVFAASRIEQDNMKLGKKSAAELDDAIQKYGQDLAKIAAANPASQLLSQSAVDEHIALIRAAHTAKVVAVPGQDDRAAVLQGALTMEQAALDREKSIYDARGKMLDLYHSKFGMSDSDFYAGREAARAEYIAAEAITFAKEAALVKGAEAGARNPQEIAAAKDKYAQLLKTHEKFVDEMRNASGQDSAGELAGKEAVENASRDAVNKYTSSLQQQLQSIEAATDARQRSKSAVEQETAAIYEQAVANMKLQASEPISEQHTQADHDAAVEMLADLEKELGLHQQIAAALSYQESVFAQQKAADRAVQDWQRAGASIASSLSNAFGTAGKAIGGMFKAYSDGMAGQLRAQQDLAKAKKLSDDDPEKIEAIQRAQLNGSLAQVKSYGDMTQAAQGFFKEGSSGYQAMAAATDVLRIAEVGLSLVKGVNAVLTQGEGDPYTAWARMGAMAAVVVGLGVALSGGIGGSGGQSAADVQKTQGTGTVLGASAEKSDSIAHSVALAAANSGIELEHTSGMLSSLKNIEASMQGLARIVVRTPGVMDATNMGIATGATSSLVEASSRLFGGVGPMGAIMGKIASLWGNTKSSVTDSGLQFGGSVKDLEAGRGYQQYASVDTTKSSWFGLSKKTSNRVETQGLSDELTSQFGQIFSDVDAALKTDASGLGISADQVTKALDGLTIDPTKLSLKGLSGDALTQAINAVIASTMDKMAQAALPGLEKFQKVGEGYEETVTRLATDYANVDSILQSLGMQFGATGVASLAARENLIDLAGGLDKFTAAGDYFLKNFFSDDEQAASLKKRINPTLAQYGLSAEGPDAAKMFRDFVVGLDTTTEEGAKAYTALMQIAPAFKSVTDASTEAAKAAAEAAVKAVQAVKDAASGLLGDVDNAFTVLQNVTKTTTDAITKRITAEKALSDAVKSTLSNMTAQGTAMMSDRGAAQAQIKAAVASVKAGGALPDAASLQSALSTVSKDASAQFSTYADYLKDLYSTKNDVTQLGEADDKALSVDQKQLDSLNAMLDSEQEQVNLLKGISTTGLTIAQAMQGLAQAIASAKQNPVVAASEALNGAYQQYLGRAPDQQGMAYWQNAVATGTPVSTAVNDIATSTEATLDKLYQSVLGRAPDAQGLAYWMGAFGPKMSTSDIADWTKAAQPEMSAISSGSENSFLKKAGVPGFATGGDFGGGWRVVGENGPELEATGPARIFNAQQTSSLFNRLASPSENSMAIVSELKSLRSENQQLRSMMESHLYAIAKYSMTTAGALDAASTGARPLNFTAAT